MDLHANMCYRYALCLSQRELTNTGDDLRKKRVMSQQSLAQDLVSDVVNWMFGWQSLTGAFRCLSIEILEGVLLLLACSYFAFGTASEVLKVPQRLSCRA